MIDDSTASSDEVAARAAFSDYLLRHGGDIDERFESFCAARAALAPYLRELAREWSGEPDRVPAPPESPRSIGGFRIVRELGRGGMGIVYEAEQSEPRRRVALKVVRGELVDPDRRRRIEHESRVLALLRHPAIVPLFGSGHTADGSPWFAMELVEGRALDVALREDRPSLRSRLVLFRTICEAIAYAHQKGVVHRDLKPSNVLLSDETSAVRGPGELGEVKILDFGLARITDADVSLISMPSDAGRIVGTLAYMSPEQLRGQSHEVDQRSDIYALGVMLYEMTTGARPYDLAGCWIGEAVERVDRTVPPRPGRLRPELRGDVETIIQKALAKDPRRRYQSASSLAEDIDRHLAGLPILAHPPSALYQLRKLVARHRSGAVAALAVAVCGLGLLGGFLWHLRVSADAEREQRVAVAKERDVAQSVVTMLTEMLASADPGRAGRDVLVVDVLDEVSRRLDDGVHQGAPLVEAALRHTLGVSYDGLGRFAEAEDHLRRAVGLRVSLLGDDHPDALLSRAALGNALQHLDRVADAEGEYRVALEGYRRSRDDEAPPVLVVRSNLGLTLQKLGRYEEAEELLRDVLATRRRVLNPDDPATSFSAIHLGSLLRTLGRIDEAAALFDEAHALRERLLGAEHPYTLTARVHRARSLQDHGRLDEAREELEQVVAARRRVLGEDHVDTWSAADALAAVMKDAGRPLEALAISSEVLARKRELLGEEHAQVVATKANLAVALRVNGRLAEAERLTREVLDHRVRHHGGDDPRTLLTMSNLAAVLVAAGRFEEARELSLDVLRLEAAHLDRDPLATIGARNTLAQALMREGDLGESEFRFRELHALLVSERGENHPSTLLISNNLATTLRRAGNVDEAISELERAIAIVEEVAPDALLAATLRMNAGMCYADQDRFVDCEAQFLIALDILERSVGPDHHQVRVAEDALARLHERWGLFERGRLWRRLDVPDAD